VWPSVFECNQFGWQPRRVSPFAPFREKKNTSIIKRACVLFCFFFFFAKPIRPARLERIGTPMSDFQPRRASPFASFREKKNTFIIKRACVLFFLKKEPKTLALRGSTSRASSARYILLCNQSGWLPRKASTVASFREKKKQKRLPKDLLKRIHLALLDRSKNTYS
jgi:hypothetical protein